MSLIGRARNTERVRSKFKLRGITWELAQLELNNYMLEKAIKQTRVWYSVSD